MYSFICFKVLADKMFTIFTTLCAVGVVMPTTAVIISHPLQILAFWIVKYSNESLLWDYILISIYSSVYGMYLYTELEHNDTRSWKITL